MSLYWKITIERSNENQGEYDSIPAAAKALIEMLTDEERLDLLTCSGGIAGSAAAMITAASCGTIDNK